MYEKIDAYVLSLIERSSPEHTAWNIESIRLGRPPHWNYIDGCMITALLAMSDITGDKRYFDFAESFIDWFVLEDGTIRTYERSKYNLDDINEGRVLFPLYEKTGKEKYKKAAENLYQQIKEQPRTFEGNFWHKAIYPNQVWLDGLYMAQPFYALYVKNFGDGDYSDILSQINNVRSHMFDEKKRLCYHGYDASRSAFWADPVTGLSQNFWLRSIGWFAVAMADLCEILPEGEGRELCRKSSKSSWKAPPLCRRGDRPVLAGGGSGRPRGQLSRDQRQQHAGLRHAQGRKARHSG